MARVYPELGDYLRSLRRASFRSDSLMVTRPACSAAAPASSRSTIRNRSRICAVASEARWLMRVTSLSPSVYMFVLNFPFANRAFCCLTMRFTRAFVMPFRSQGSLRRPVLRILNFVCRLQFRGFLPCAGVWVVVTIAEEVCALVFFTIPGNAHLNTPSSKRGKRRSLLLLADQHKSK